MVVKSFLISVLVVFCATIIESSILSNLSFLFVIPDLVLICSVYFSTINGKTYGECNGLVSGLFLDWITGVPFGFNCLYRIVIGYLFGIFSETIIVSGFIMPMATIGIATVIKRLFIILISFFFPRINLTVYGFISYDFLYEFILNIILAPFIFRFLNFFKKSLLIKDTKDMIDNVQWFRF